MCKVGFTIKNHGVFSPISDLLYDCGITYCRQEIFENDPLEMPASPSVCRLERILTVLTEPLDNRVVEPRHRVVEPRHRVVRLREEVIFVVSVVTKRCGSFSVLTVECIESDRRIVCLD